jgi:hypothetical protein
MDRYVTVNQGEVFYITEALARLEGLERGPAGNTSLAAAFALAQDMDEDEVLVVQESEYTGAGKHVQAQLTFAAQQGIEILFGDPRDEICGRNIVLPEHPRQIRVVDVDLDRLRRSYIRNCLEATGVAQATEADVRFMAEDTNTSDAFVRGTVAELRGAA